jgi:hypothetical protein
MFKDWTGWRKINMNPQVLDPNMKRKRSGGSGFKISSLLKELQKSPSDYLGPDSIKEAFMATNTAANKKYLDPSLPPSTEGTGESFRISTKVTSMTSSKYAPDAGYTKWVSMFRWLHNSS